MEQPELTIYGCINLQYCPATGCPLINIHNTLKNRTRDPLIQFSDLKVLARTQGLEPRNYFYGTLLPLRHLADVGEAIYTADCTAGQREGQPFNHCGSLLAEDHTYRPTPIQSLAINYLKAVWAAYHNFRLTQG